MNGIKRFIEVDEEGTIPLHSTGNPKKDVLAEHNVKLDIDGDNIIILSNDSIATYSVVKKGKRFVLELGHIEQAFR